MKSRISTPIALDRMDYWSQEIMFQNRERFEPNLDPWHERVQRAIAIDQFRSAQKLVASWR